MNHPASTRTAAVLPLSPAIEFLPELLLRAQGMRVAFFDVDGVLTDGGIFIVSPPGNQSAGNTSDPWPPAETIKRFHTLDGHGLKLLKQSGIEPVVITGRDSPALRARLQALGITRAHYGTEQKLAAAEATLAEMGVSWAQAAAMGDDWPDLPVMRRCAVSCAPVNAHVEVRAAAHFVTVAAGGSGAVREFCDLMLVANGHYARLLAQASA